jgi:hypothetical protein
MQRSFARQQDTTGATPSFFLPPDAENARVEDSDEATSSDSASNDADGVAEYDEPDGEEPARGIAKPSNNPCGELPSDVENLKNLLTCAKLFKGRGKEAMYCKHPQLSWTQNAVPYLHAGSFQHGCTKSLFDVDALADLDFEAWHAQQKDYFKQLNKHVSEPVYDEEDDASEPNNFDEDRENYLQIDTSRHTKWKDKLSGCRRNMQLSIESAPCSDNAIVIAAIETLENGLFTIPQSQGEWNTRQCLGFLLHAYHLQSNKNSMDAGSSANRASAACFEVQE